MILLPDRYANLRPPIATAQHSFRDVILPAEAYASLLMWVRPRLLGWPRPIHWLSPLVDARRKNVGDLYGLDSAGNLIIVKIKLERSVGLKDPFGSLLLDLKRRARSHAWSAKGLRAKWLDWFASEKKFVENQMATFWSTEPMTATYPGVGPYSFDRYAVCEFRSLYCTLVAPRWNGKYERAVHRALRLREDAGDPPPVFVGLVASTGDHFPLSVEGRRNLTLLQKYADPSRIVLRGMNARMGSKVLRVSCWTPVPA